MTTTRHDDHSEQHDQPMPPCCRDSGHPDGCPQHVQALSVLDPRRAARGRRRTVGAPGQSTPSPDGPEAA